MSVVKINNKKRNQLIGFIALVLVALVLFPYVITDKSNRSESTISLLPDSNINQSNEMELVDSLESINNELPADDLSNQAAVANQESTDKLDQSDSEQPDIQTNNTAESITDTAASNVDKKNDNNYVIQLVALKNRQKIEELIALLRFSNYNVYTDPAKPKEGDLIRLIVGYYPTKEQAEIVAIDLKNITKLKDFQIRKQ